MSDYYKRFIESYPAYSGDKLIEKAFAVAEKAHEGQRRNSGEPYIIHPFEVVKILADLGLDSISICSGLLHDVPEDTAFTLEEVEREFSPEIARIVDGVTKLTKFGFQSKEEAQAESLRKMFLAMAADIRVVIIKLADRLHNMRTLDYKDEAKQKEKARETLEIYAPLAHRLGINTFKWEFEDLSLKYLEPEAYFDVASRLKTTRAEREIYIENIVATLKEKLAPLGVHAEIEGRPKHIYSIYKKMKNKAKTFEELYDLIAVRIIVDTVKDCYGVLGTVHTIWRPLPMRFKDYIAVPKQNMYQSLHTTLLGQDGIPFEVQIRTYEMHRTAEYGIAAHWKYKDGTTNQKHVLDDKLAWLRELMEWQSDMKDSREFMEALKINFFSDNVFVYTPKGDVKDLAKGSTPLDFAYSIHSHIGHKCVGAKVNGRIVPLNYELKTGDIVEVMTNPNSKGPSRDWINMVKSATARSKIRAWFKKELKEENIHKGREMLEKEAKRAGYDLRDLTRSEWLKEIFKKYTFNNIDDMYAAVGYGGIATAQILTRLIEKYRKENHIQDAVVVAPEKAKKHSGQDVVVVRGYSDMVVRLAHCCNPLPGDEIIGYVTRGRGVSVHRADCSNLKDTAFEDERRIEVAWSSEETAKYTVEVQINGHDRPGLLAEISQMLFSLGYSISAINARSNKQRDYSINLKIEVSAIADLEALMAKIRRVPSVSDVFRVNN
ncbi:MAG: bifunctional (p)ppGpp synthetase/guanosine-3',5'-bis(diphosphate) 3'-pyrophosphohydrolase [Christensenellaceae bacterium]|nr:bifunctional (p)ppGpp synthetase/guanosine-3',5'-bis(diphosphate) 3'-pyrophosphohydrolase [Christensenellaceae bacterium]